MYNYFIHSYVISVTIPFSAHRPWLQIVTAKSLMGDFVGSVCSGDAIQCVLTVVDGSGSTNGLRDMEQMKPLMKMVFYSIEKLKRLKLSKEVPFTVLQPVVCNSAFS